MRPAQVERRDRIFTAAVEKFAENGAEQTTMQEIAKAAGVGKGTLYRYFDDKEDLISSLIEMGFERLIAQIKEGIEQVEDPVVKLEETVKIQLDFYNQRRDFCKFLTRESLGYKNKFEHHIKQIRSNYTVLIEDIIRRGIEAGAFKEMEVETAATSLLGAVNITALHWFMFEDEFPVEKIKDQLLELYFDGLKAE